QLVLRPETKPRSVYRLVVAKNGPKLQKPEVPLEKSRRSRLPGGGFNFESATMAQLASLLSDNLDRPVLNETGIDGFYDFKLQLEEDRPRPMASPGAAGPAPAPLRATTNGVDLSSTAIFAELPKQLGLQLVADKTPMEYLVIDRLEPPSAN